MSAEHTEAQSPPPSSSTPPSPVAPTPDVAPAASNVASGSQPRDQTGQQVTPTKPEESQEQQRKRELVDGLRSGQHEAFPVGPFKFDAQRLIQMLESARGAEATVKRRGRGAGDKGGQHQPSSVFRGVNIHSRTGRWEAHLWDGAQQVHIGCFDSELHAAIAYDLLSLKNRGSEAPLNFGIGNYTTEIDAMRSIPKDDLVKQLRASRKTLLHEKGVPSRRTNQRPRKRAPPKSTTTPAAAASTPPVTTVAPPDPSAPGPSSHPIFIDDDTLPRDNPPATDFPTSTRPPATPLSPHRPQPPTLPTSPRPLPTTGKRHRTPPPTTSAPPLLPSPMAPPAHPPGTTHAPQLPSPHASTAGTSSYSHSPPNPSATYPPYPQHPYYLPPAQPLHPHPRSSHPNPPPGFAASPPDPRTHQPPARQYPSSAYTPSAHFQPSTHAVPIPAYTHPNPYRHAPPPSLIHSGSPDQTPTPVAAPAAHSLDSPTARNFLSLTLQSPSGTPPFTRYPTALLQRDASLFAAAPPLAGMGLLRTAISADSPLEPYYPEPHHRAGARHPSQHPSSPQQPPRPPRPHSAVPVPALPLPRFAPPHTTLLHPQASHLRLTPQGVHPSYLTSPRRSPLSQPPTQAHTPPSASGGPHLPSPSPQEILQHASRTSLPPAYTFPPTAPPSHPTAHHPNVPPPGPYGRPSSLSAPAGPALPASPSSPPPHPHPHQHLHPTSYPNPPPASAPPPHHPTHPSMAGFWDLQATLVDPLLHPLPEHSLPPSFPLPRHPNPTTHPSPPAHAYPHLYPHALATAAHWDELALAHAHQQQAAALRTHPPRLQQTMSLPNPLPGSPEPSPEAYSLLPAPSDPRHPSQPHPAHTARPSRTPAQPTISTTYYPQPKRARWRPPPSSPDTWGGSPLSAPPYARAASRLQSAPSAPQPSTRTDHPSTQVPSTSAPYPAASSGQTAGPGPARGSGGAAGTETRDWWVPGGGGLVELGGQEAERDARGWGRGVVQQAGVTAVALAPDTQLVRQQRQQQQQQQQQRDYQQQLHQQREYQQQQQLYEQQQQQQQELLQQQQEYQQQQMYQQQYDQQQQQYERQQYEQQQRYEQQQHYTQQHHHHQAQQQHHHHHHRHQQQQEQQQEQQQQQQQQESRPQQALQEHEHAPQQ